VPDEDKRARFERLALPHMDAAFGLARWLTRDSTRAEEAVQEAYLRAFRFFDGFRGENARPWLLGIVRNTCHSLLEREREAPCAEFDESACGEEAVAAGAVVRFPIDPETAAIERADRERVQRCLAALPLEYREAIVLREVQGCSYKEIAQIADIPLGTVMSRLARGRALLARALTDDGPRAKETGT
jgi:RNA polymerase sigma-70 factor, ECF subfamily